MRSVGFAALSLVLMLGAACGGGTSTPNRAPAPQALNTFELDFDGGFAYAMASNRVDVTGVGETPGMTQHRMRLGVTRTAPNYDANATTLRPAEIGNSLAWDLTGYDATIAPGGAALPASGVRLPAADGRPDACGNLADDAPEANSLSHIVDLYQLHPGATLDETKIASTLALTDGEFRVRRAGYCWQIERAGETGAQKRLVQGVRGMRYLLDVNAQYIDIKLARRGTATVTDTIRLLPAADRRIAARISTAFNDPTVLNIRYNDLDPHFDMFYALLKFAPGVAPNTPYRARFMQREVGRTPGDDCISVRLGPRGGA